METRRCLAPVVAVVGAVAFSLISPARGQQCPRHVGDLDLGILGPSPTRIEVCGSHLYLGNNKVNIIDVSGPEEPEQEKSACGGDSCCANG